jgi:hypothetical protein
MWGVLLGGKMAEKEYKCGYRHCLKPNEKIPASEVVMVGKQRYHKECAELHKRIEIIKRIYFDYINEKSDYVQVVGVINNLIFSKGYDIEYVEFTMKYTAIYGKNIKTPYLLHTIIDNGIVEKKYNNENQKKEVIRRFDNRTRINQASQRKVK